MGSPLTGNTVASTYTGLLKTSDTGAISGALKTVSDGSGNDSALQVSNAAVNTTGNFSVGTDKLTVAAASGNTVAAGTLGCTGNFAVNTNKFSVLAASGNTTVGGTLSVAGAVSLNNDLMTNNRIVLNGNYGISQNAATGSNLFVGTSQFSGLVTFTGGMQFQSAVNMTNDLTVAGVTTLNGNVVLGNAAGDAITVTGTPTFAQTATFNGIANFNGNVALGSDTSDTVTVNAVVGATVKTTPANTDYVYIQDAAASNAFKKTLVSSLLSQVAVTKKESGLLAVPTAMGSVSYNHALGAAPTQFQAVFVCDQDDCGFIANDELAIENVLQWVQLTVEDNNRIPGFRPAFSIYCDTNYIYARRTRSAAPIGYPNANAAPLRSDVILTYDKSTGDVVELDPTKWNIKFRMISL